MTKSTEQQQQHHQSYLQKIPPVVKVEWVESFCQNNKSVELFFSAVHSFTTQYQQNGALVFFVRVQLAAQGQKCYNCSSSISSYYLQPLQVQYFRTVELCIKQYIRKIEHGGFEITKQPTVE